MKATDRAVLLGLGLVALVAVFWFVILAPKREQATELKDEVAALEDSVAAQEALVAAGRQAEENFDSNYQRLVVLGKAVPEDEDTSSLFLQLNEIAGRTGVDFDAIALSAGASTAATTAAAETTTDQNAQAGETAAPESSTTEPAAQPVAAPATEAAAATLPIGATVGPAGLGVMPYSIDLRGSFFQLADFIANVDRLVGSKGAQAVVDGRLVTVDGFALTGDEEGGFSTLNATLAVTTFVTPADQGLTAGATPVGPAVPAPGAPTPASNTTPAP